MAQAYIYVAIVVLCRTSCTSDYITCPRGKFHAEILDITYETVYSITNLGNADILSCIDVTRGSTCWPTGSWQKQKNSCSDVSRSCD